MNKWEYGGYYKKYDMNGEIVIGYGKVKVHNIFDPLPEFMLQADCVFCDPPCSKGNINSFYTKADRSDYQDSYEPFVKRFWECIDEIKPQKLFIELFKSNVKEFSEKGAERYKYTKLYNSTYYHNSKNKCFVLVCQNEPFDYPIENMDEENIIEWICENVNYEYIGDLCIGQGLVGIHSNSNKKKFVGTEINKKRLAVMIEKINKEKI